MVSGIGSKDLQDNPEQTRFYLPHFHHLEHDWLSHRPGSRQTHALLTNPMKNLSFLAISSALLAFIIFLFVGVYAGFELTPPREKPVMEEALNYPETTSREPVLRQLIIVQLDSLGSETPQAETIFHVSIQASTQHISVILLDSSGRETHPLIDSFKIEVDGSFSPDFLDQIAVRSLKFDHYVLLDRFAIDQYDQWLGHYIPADSLSYRQENPEMDFWIVEQPDALTQSINQICQSSSLLPVDANLMNLFLMVIPKHMRTDYSIDTMIVDWKYLNQTEDPFTCEVMGP
jgi:hypothetical protein